MHHSEVDRRRYGRSKRSICGLVAGLALIAAACGSDDTPEQSDVSDPPISAPITEASTVPPSDSTVAEEGLERIVSLSPTHTEVLFAIGAGDQLVAVDQFSDHPAATQELPNELSGFEPNVEAIAAYEPDLVVIGGDFTGLGEQLDDLGIAWFDGPVSTLDGTYEQIEELGALTGKGAEAEELIASMQTQVDEIVADTPVPAEAITFYHEIDPTLYSADSTTFIGEIYSLLGLENIADRAEANSGGFPQLNAEFVVSADPDLIFLADTKCCGESAATVAARDGWGGLSAVQNAAVIEMDDDIASRWGPRVVDYLAAVAAAVEQVAVPA